MGRTIAVLEPYADQMAACLVTSFDDWDVLFVADFSEAERIRVARAADVMLVGWSPVSGDVIEAATRLRVIHKMGVGVDKIDLAAALRCKVRVLRAAGINADAVAEMTILLMLAVLRELPWAAAELRQGRFQKELLRGRTDQLAGRNVGLVGLGHVGRAVASRLSSFGVSIAGFDPRRDLDPAALGVAPMDFGELLGWSDILSLHAPLVPATEQLVNAEAIGAMRTGAILINTARGGLVDEAALCAALGSGKLRGAGLDVTASEPIDPRSPLLALDQVIVTPHIGGAVNDNFPNVVRRARANIDAFFDGRTIDPEDLVC
jgi:phosphoglycerate dehydrogenase-like enzyme